jgi:hypothetical protein
MPAAKARPQLLSVPVLSFDLAVLSQPCARKQVSVARRHLRFCHFLQASAVAAGPL